MHALVTGATGTVGRALVACLEGQGARVTRWDRSVVPCDRYAPMEQFVRETAPDVLFHLAIASRPTGRENESWLVNVGWTSELAWIARTLRVPFVFTSTVMVFSDRARGPFEPASPIDADHGYGLEKRRAEERVFHQLPLARVVRLGWQIADEVGSNNLWDHLVRQAATPEGVRASTRWLPACGFVQDTAEALVRAADADPGVYLLDQNERWSFYDIASALARRAGDPFPVRPTDDPVGDQRMRDERLGSPSLRERLPTLS